MWIQEQSNDPLTVIGNSIAARRRVECDTGYCGELCNNKILDVLDPEEVSQIQSNLGQWHETINKQLKQFKCLKSVWKHSMEHYFNVTRAVIIITQLGIDNNEELFEIVGYDDSDWYA